MIYSFIFFLAGFIIAAVTTPWVIRLAQSGIGLDHADGSRKHQENPIPRIGGAPIMLAVSLGFQVGFDVLTGLTLLAAYLSFPA